MRYPLAGALIITAAFTAYSAPAGAQDWESGSPAQARLGRAVDAAMEALQPFFTRAERSLIERKCGYAAGSWDGRSISVNNGVLTCSNGRRVEDPEVRAMVDAADARISRQVLAAMESPAVRAAISAVAEEGRQVAMAALGDLTLDVDVDGHDVDVDVDVDVDADEIDEDGAR